MLSESPVVRSKSTRLLFVLTATITAGLLLCTQYWHPSGVGLTRIFFQLFFELDSVAASWTLGILVLAVFVSAAYSGRSLITWIGDHTWTVTAVTTVMLCVGSLLVYRNHPLSMDEYAQYLQSQVFAAGRISGNFPVPLMDWLIPSGFQNHFLSVSKSTGAVVSAYWPSFSLLLAPFTALGVPWACNPVISGATLLVARRLALKLYNDQEAAALVVLLIVASPEFLINGISYYSMPAHLLANALYALLLVEPTRFKALLAGFVGSIALTLHNPFPHLLFALPWLLWVASRRDGTRLTACLVVGYVPLSLLLGLGWLWFMGHIRYAGFAPTSSNDLGSIWHVLSVFSLPNPAVMLVRMIDVAKLWIWAAPGVVVLAVVGAWNGWARPSLRLIIVSAMLTFFGYFLVPVDQGHGWGNRYFHSAWISLPLLAAGALTRMGGGRKHTVFADDGTRAFIIACAVLMILIGGTLRAVQVRAFMTRDLAQLPAYAGRERHVMLLNTNYSSYGADLVQNDPWLRGDVIRMISHGREDDARMMSLNFPGLHEVFRDQNGSVWSEHPNTKLPPRLPAERGP